MLQTSVIVSATALLFATVTPCDALSTALHQESMLQPFLILRRDHPPSCMRLSPEKLLSHDILCLSIVYNGLQCGSGL